ncbi:hypothetical protein PHISCL_06596 [Aspergillus sclerotialis]|uniref:Uncharacterized protein n=1 Tax=Aspergillus sclerotialis TaxID=2070753 RepID=A0A3A2ZD56_9EURO|nr:hypothetical protein PHISCL_06596 [Aspergillus sclerotialis]
MASDDEDDYIPTQSDLDYQYLPIFMDLDLLDLEIFFPPNIPEPSLPDHPDWGSAVDRLLRLEATLDNTEDFLDLWESAVRLLIPFPFRPTSVLRLTSQFLASPKETEDEVNEPEDELEWPEDDFSEWIDWTGGQGDDNNDEGTNIITNHHTEATNCNESVDMSNQSPVDTDRAPQHDEDNAFIHLSPQPGVGHSSVTIPVRPGLSLFRTPVVSCSLIYPRTMEESNQSPNTGIQYADVYPNGTERARRLLWHSARERLYVDPAAQAPTDQDDHSSLPTDQVDLNQADLVYIPPPLTLHAQPNVNQAQTHIPVSSALPAQAAQTIVNEAQDHESTASLSAAFNDDQSTQQAQRANAVAPVGLRIDVFF